MASTCRRVLETLVLTLWTVGAALAQTPQASAPAELDAYNVVWTSPSHNAAGSMPLGNGEVGVNMWVEENGNLLFYIARTDAWSECNRLLKLGKVRVSLSPNPFAKGQPFRQELRLRAGQVVITAGDVTLRMFVDAAAPVIYVVGESATPRTMTAQYEPWRTTKHILKGEELESSWTMFHASDSIEVWESPDETLHLPAEQAVVAWRHRNAYSVVPLTLKHQSLESAAALVKDPLVNRTFGGWMVGADMVQDGPTVLKSAGPTTKFSVGVVAYAAQTETAAAWDAEAQQLASKTHDAVTAAVRTAAWWHDFWDRSWIFIQGDQPTVSTSEMPGALSNAGSATISPATRAYVLQRWMTACGGRGNYPIKFNGSIFTVDPKFAGGPDFNPDWRRWGDCFWWQNTRLPYFPMIARGDWDEVHTLFRLYENVLPLCKARAKLYHQVEGAYFPETMTIFGAYSNGDYGWDRKGHQPNEVLSPWWRYTWQQGLELTALMLDYYEHTDDAKFFTDELVPMAHEVLRYYDTRFARDQNGKLIISPTQSAETYWTGVVNDTPSVAGLQGVLDRLLAIPTAVAPPAERAYWQKMKAATPALPLQKKDGMTLVSPAEKFDPKRMNCENPELYATWPFGLFGVGRPRLQIGIDTFLNRIEKASHGWQYDGQCAAILGLTAQAQSILLGKVMNSHENFRFPAMWGPNYDWLPDQDHGSNIMLTTQHMLLTTAGDQIFVLPAWPPVWHVSFKLCAPHRTVIECVYRDGKLEKLAVTPPERKKDVQLPAWLHERNP